MAAARQTRAGRVLARFARTLHWSSGQFCGYARGDLGRITFLQPNSPPSPFSSMNSTPADYSRQLRDGCFQIANGFVWPKPKWIYLRLFFLFAPLALIWSNARIANLRRENARRS